MQAFYRNLFFFLFISLVSFHTISTRPLFNKQKFSLQKKSVEQPCEKLIIIVDCINVLFKENYSGFAQKIGYGILTSYALTHWKNPGHRCLEMLHAMSASDNQKPHVVITLQEKIMPRCIVELHEGKKTCLEVKDEINTAIDILDKEKFFTSTKEKNLMLSIINLMLDTTAILYLTEPIKPIITLMQKLKNNGHALYLCANIPHEFYKALNDKYPAILALFDGMVVSSQTKMVKPDKPIFEHLIRTHKIDPTKCIIIDNAQESLATAQSLGMRGIVYEKPSSLNTYLKKQGILF